MTSTWLAAAVALTAITLTYFICVRPHLPGRRRRDVETRSEDRAIGRQLADLRDELRALQADRGVGGARGPGIDAPPPGRHDRPA
jgi:hypothetical protein